jgi:hypothetical protein
MKETFNNRGKKATLRNRRGQELQLLIEKGAKWEGKD